MGLNLFNIDLSKSYKDTNFISKVVKKILIFAYQYVNDFLKKKIKEIILNDLFLIQYLNQYKNTFDRKRLIIKEVLQLSKKYILSGDKIILIHIGSGSGQETLFIANKIKNTIIYSIEFFKIIIKYQRKNLSLQIQDKKFFKIGLYKKINFIIFIKKIRLNKFIFLHLLCNLQRLILLNHFFLLFLRLKILKY